jgi:uncharacterized protein
VIYLDSSALVKLVAEEPESASLERWLTARAEIRVSSALARVEVTRYCLRDYLDALPAAAELIGGLELIPVTLDLLEQAASVGPPLLRSLDAIHLASALSLGSDLTAFVAYDRRLQAAAQAEGLPIVAPA